MFKYQTPRVLDSLVTDMACYGCAAWEVIDTPYEFAIVRRTDEVIWRHRPYYV